MPEHTDHVSAAAAPCPACGETAVKIFCTACDRVLPGNTGTWTIVQCGRCLLGRTIPAPSGDLESLYPPEYLGDTERIIAEFLSGRLARTRSWRDQTEKAALLEGFARQGRILDFGCGDGRFLWALDGARWERTGVDISKSTLALVQARMPDLHLCAAGIDSVELAAGSFDAVTMWHALEHVPDPGRTLRRASDLLKPGGLIVVSSPNLDSLQARLFRRHWYAFDDVPRHLFHFSPGSLSLLLRGAGFQVERVLCFSRRVNWHTLKHSLVNWSKDRFGSRSPYYVLKPVLLFLRAAEILQGKCGILTLVARKSSA